jgi:hypothetical protein
MIHPYLTEPALILSHGQYAGDGKRFIIPENILLVQYTKSGEVLTMIDALHIIENYRGEYKTMQPFFLKEKNGEKVYVPDGILELHKGGEEVDDISLTFDKDINNESYSKLLRMRIVNPDNSLQYERDKERDWKISLSYVIHHLSVIYRKEYPGKVIPVCQLSCRLLPMNESSLITKNIRWPDGFLRKQRLSEKFWFENRSEYDKNGYKNLSSWLTENYETVNDIETFRG